MIVTFNKSEKGFSFQLNQEVSKYFASKKTKMTGDSRLYLKSVLLLSTFLIIYFSIITASLPGWATLLLCVLLGINAGCIGFNIMHDAGHGSYSQKRWVNELMSHSLNMLGGDISIWKEKHNVNHHSYTNIEGLDEDIDIQPFIRTNQSQPWKWYHRYQHIYSFFLYSLGYLAWVFKLDLQKYFSGKIGGRRMKKMNSKQHVIFWASKTLFVINFILIPIFIFGPKALIGFLIFTMTCGLFISIVFQMAHVVEETDFLAVAAVASSHVDNEWAVHQVLTTANFSTKNKLYTFLFGGLNYQVEHHLFPRISHVHYPELNKCIKKVCSENNLPYNEFPTFLDAIKSHIRHLKKVGAKPQEDNVSLNVAA